ncbi:fimbrial protein [Stenotrophomonas maltophilia]|uniref:fimbrial protein n=1 Tax=Stenotrophomonas maltophilia TaxID=40324 RepID=UPI003916E89D
MGTASLLSIAGLLLFATGNASASGRLTLSGEVKQATCVLQGSTITAPSVRADLIDAPSSGHDFSVEMTCPLAGIQIDLTLRDANDAGNTGHLLTRGAGSTGSGWTLGLLRGGSAVAFATPWNHGPSVLGENRIALTVVYVQESPTLVPGQVLGRATLEAAYR